MECRVNNVPNPREKKCRNVSYPVMELYLPLNWSVTEDGLTADTGLRIKMIMWKWHIIDPVSQIVLIEL